MHSLVPFSPNVINRRLKSQSDQDENKVVVPVWTEMLQCGTPIGACIYVEKIRHNVCPNSKRVGTSKEQMISCFIRFSTQKEQLNVTTTTSASTCREFILYRKPQYKNKSGDSLRKLNNTTPCLLLSAISELFPCVRCGKPFLWSLLENLHITSL